MWGKLVDMLVTCRAFTKGLKINWKISPQFVCISTQEVLTAVLNAVYTSQARCPWCFGGGISWLNQGERVTSPTDYYYYYYYYYYFTWILRVIEGSLINYVTYIEINWVLFFVLFLRTYRLIRRFKSLLLLTKRYNSNYTQITLVCICYVLLNNYTGYLSYMVCSHPTLYNIQYFKNSRK